MLDSISNKPALKKWTNRTDKDWGVLLIDMWAYLADILCYYQERIINEAYLNTSVLDESVTNLFHNIGYKPMPAISASTLVHFEANDGQSGIVPRQFQIQATDNPEEIIFETDEEIEISSNNNEMKLSDSKTVSDLEEDANSLVLDKNYYDLHKGDFILITDEVDENVVKISDKKNIRNKTLIQWDQVYSLDRDYDVRATKILKFASNIEHFARNASSPPFGRIKGKLSAITRTLIGKKRERDIVPYVNVELIDLISKNPIAETTSDKYGNFSFYKIFPGTYKIRMVRRDYWNWLSWPRKNITSSFFQVLPSQETKIDLKLNSIELLYGSDIDYRYKANALVISNESFSEIERSIISSTIFLDDEYPEIQTQSLLILSKSINAPFDRKKQVYRINNIQSKFHSGFGIKKNVTKLELLDTNNSSLLEEAFVWNDLPPSGVKKPTLLEMLNRFFRKNKMIKTMTKQAKKQITKEVKSNIKIIESGKGIPPKLMKSATKALKPKPAKMIQQLEKLVDSSDSKKSEELIDSETSYSQIYTPLITFLKNKINLEWIGFISDENIIKDDKKNSLKIITKDHFLTINLDEDNLKGWLTIDDERTFDLYLEIKNGKIILYWDKLQANNFRVTDTEITVNPTIELKTDPQIPSLKRISHDNILTIEGSHDSIKSGSYLSIFDDSALIQGQFLGKSLNPLSNAQMRLYEIKVKNDKNYLKLFSVDHQYETHNDGVFQFPELPEGKYIIGSFMPTILFWNSVIQNISEIDSAVSNKINEIVIENSNLSHDRNVATSSRLISELLTSIPEVINFQRNKVMFLETSVSKVLKDIQEVIDNLLILKTEFNNILQIFLDSKEKNHKEKIKISSESIVEYYIPQFKEQTFYLKNSLKSLIELTSSRKLLSISNPLKNILRHITTVCSIIDVSLIQIDLSLSLPIKNDFQNECCIGRTKEFTVNKNSNLKFTIIADFFGEFDYSTATSTLKRHEIMRVLHVNSKFNKTHVTFTPPLKHSYLLGYVKIHGNNVLASHGRTIKNEILGSGDASEPFQQFLLQQKPLSYISSMLNPSKARSSLSVLVNGEKWEEVDDLLQSDRFDKHYSIWSDHENNSKIIFGDGINGQRIPRGIDNILATYRIGSGSLGNVKVDTLTNPVDNRPSIKTVTNILPGMGGFEETPIQQKHLATAQVKTLDKAISLDDYKNLALCISFIAKAKSYQIFEDGIPSIKLVVVPKNGDLLNEIQKLKLRKFLDARRDTSIPLHIDSFEFVPIDLVVEINIDDNYLKSKVINSVLSALRPKNKFSSTKSLFSFENLDLGQGISLTQIYSIIERIPGVSYVVVKKFRRRSSKIEVEDVIMIQDNEIIQCEDDSLDPSKGIIKIISNGGLEV